MYLFRCKAQMGGKTYEGAPATEAVDGQWPSLPRGRTHTAYRLPDGSINVGRITIPKR